MVPNTVSDVIPSSVNILGLTFSVVIGRTEPEEEGYCSPSRQMICIGEDLSFEKMRQVFFHELVHAILGQLGYAELNEDERLVQGLAIGLHQALIEPTSSS